MTNNRTHIVRLGECMAIIADQYGFSWRTLWELPENAALRDKRKNPNVLLEGDQIVIPPKRSKDVSVHTGDCHRFQLIEVPSKFRMQLLSGGYPRAGLHYTCKINDTTISGKTSKDGLVQFAVPPGARQGTLVIEDGDVTEEYELRFGELDPIDEISGIQQRLNNLGYDCEVTRELDEQTQEALALFRFDKDLQEQETLDQTIRDAILDAHGS